MRWPDLFFKSRKSRPIPEIATVPAKPPESVEVPKTVAPAKTETVRVGASVSERDKIDSLRALTETDNERISLPEKVDPTATRPLPEPDSAHAKTTALPPVSRPTTLSLRQRAKLTDDARSLPKKEEDVAPEAKPQPEKTSEPEPSPAVVPAAFTVPVETGTIMESSPAKPADLSPAPGAETPPVPVASAPEGPKDYPAPPADKPAPPETSPPSDTARVHLAHSTTSESAPPVPAPDRAKGAVEPREKQEFILANGERIFGHVLSETPQTIYLDHGTLGVLTLPRAQVASKPIEVILINGDRIVGDLIAETPECLYIKHASLGMVTVPHGQRSTRVVEAILKDGDRILGEVLAETENFTVIRSATLGTVAVQHEQVAMLNRKIEQMQLRSLPGPAAALEDKKG